MIKLQNNASHKSLIAIVPLLCFLMTLAGCLSVGPFHRLDTKYAEGDSTYILNVPLIKQKAGACCGSACLAMASDYWGMGNMAKETITRLPCPEAGFSGKELKSMANEAGLSAEIFSGNISDLYAELLKTRPVIAMLKSQGTGFHYTLVIGFSRKDERIILNDPGLGRVYISVSAFKKKWRKSKNFSMLLIPLK